MNRTDAPGEGPNRRPPFSPAATRRLRRGDGDAPVQAYIAAMPGWKRELGERLDELITRDGAERPQGSALELRRSTASRARAGSCRFTCSHRYVKVTFFRGCGPGTGTVREGKDEDGRWVDIFEGGWMRRRWRRGSARRLRLPGWGKV